MNVRKDQDGNFERDATETAGKGTTSRRPADLEGSLQHEGKYAFGRMFEEFI